jgi:hypothetical protein
MSEPVTRTIVSSVSISFIVLLSPEFGSWVPSSWFLVPGSEVGLLDTWFRKQPLDSAIDPESRNQEPRNQEPFFEPGTGNPEPTT